MFRGTGRPAISSTSTNASCPPSRAGNGSELRMARLIDSDAAKPSRAAREEGRKRIENTRK